jgi:hypothetical protein
MSYKLTLGLVAAASLGAMALAPSAASAKPWGWGGGWGGCYSGNPAYDEGGCYVMRRVLTPFGYRPRTVKLCD